MRKQPNSRMCFLCGRQNPIGLKLDFYEDPEAGQVRVEFTVSDDYQGYPGVVHGGSDEDLMATLKLTVRYRRPTPTETPLVAVGWVERMSGVGARVAAEIRLSDGTVTAECEATIGNIPEEFRLNWEQEKQYWKVYE